MTYRGELYPDVKAQWPAIISPDQHYAIKALLSTPERRTNDRKGRGTKYLGSGLFRCGCPACNATMVTTKGRLSKTRNTTELARIYTCVDKHMGLAAPGTRHPTRNVGDVDDYVASLVVARLSDPTFLEALATANGEGMADLVEQRRDIQLRMDETGHALEAGTLTVAQATTANKALMERLETLNNQLQAADNSGALRHLEGMEDPAVWWVTAPLETRRALLDALMTVTRGLPRVWLTPHL